MAEKGVLRVKVASSRQEDVGKGIVRIGSKQIKTLGVEREDVVEIKGKRTTAAIAVPGYPEDQGLDIVRMDGLVRGNAGVGIGEQVELKKGIGRRPRRSSCLLPKRVLG